MKIELGTIRETPFVGIFAIATEKFILVPKTISAKEETKITNIFDEVMIKASI